MSLAIPLCRAEMHNGLHPSLDEPPTTSMFTCTGGGQAAPSASANDAISQLTAALSPSIAPSSSHAGRGAALGASPAKLIDNCTSN